MVEKMLLVTEILSLNEICFGIPFVVVLIFICQKAIWLPFKEKHSEEKKNHLFLICLLQNKKAV